MLVLRQSLKRLLENRLGFTELNSLGHRISFLLLRAHVNQKLKITAPDIETVIELFSQLLEYGFDVFVAFA